MSKNKSYFSHDSNARNDEKMLALRMKHGATGYGVYFMILERLREEKDYMSAKNYDVLAFDFHVSVEMVQSVVEDFELFEFTEDGKKFYSLSFLNRMKLKDEISKKRSEAGKKGMQIRHNKPITNDNKPITNVNQTDNKLITNDTIGDNKIITSKVKESKVNKSKEKEYLEVVDFFNRTCVRLPSIKITDKRKSTINARIKEHSKEEVLKMIKRASESDFLAGQNQRDWSATFDWLFRPNNFVKVLEGNYDNKTKTEIKKNTEWRGKLLT
jgi:hypothetical protein